MEVEALVPASEIKEEGEITEGRSVATETANGEFKFDHRIFGRTLCDWASDAQSEACICCFPRFQS